MAVGPANVALHRPAAGLFRNPAFDLRPPRSPPAKVEKLSIFAFSRMKYRYEQSPRMKPTNDEGRRAIAVEPAHAESKWPRRLR